MTFLNLNHHPDAELRRKIISTALDMNRLGINRGKSGNVSARVSDGFLVTPTGIAYSETKPEQIVAMKLDGTHSGEILPSSEWRFHRDIYASRPDVHAIVHTHSTFATTLACVSRAIPAFHYMIAIAGGDNVRCAPYATFGSQALSDFAVDALKDRKACLLAQHGMIAVDATLEKALSVAVEVESLAQMYWQILQVNENPPVLSDVEMATVIEKFKTYGQQSV
jgi:L-fuculose-phosphate aldolase